MGQFRFASRSDSRAGGWCWIAWALAAFVVVRAFAAAPPPRIAYEHPDEPTFVLRDLPRGKPLRLLIYGDTRFTNPANTRVTNPRARKWLAERVGEQHADAIFFTGDLPFQGSSPADWKVFDTEAASWAHDPHVFPTVGNHEVIHDARLGQQNFFGAFPQIAGNGTYSVLLGNVLLINLNTTEPVWPEGRQADWLKHQLDHIPSQVDFVVLQMHVPLIADTQTEFIANIPGADGINLRRYLEARALTARQKFIVVSGHIHNYERFESNGITHLITGGGGAAPYPVVVRGPQDQYRDKGFPVFHYVMLTVDGKKAEGTMYKIADPTAAEYSLAEKDHFTETAR